MAARSPRPQLNAFMLGYLGLKSRVDILRERHLPSGEVELLLNLGDPYRVQHPVLSSEWTLHRRAAVIGVHNSHAVTEETGTQHVLVVRLKPAGAHLLFDVPMHELANGFVQLDVLSPELIRMIPDELVESDWESRFWIMDLIIAKRIDRFTAQASRAAWAWQKLYDANGILSIRSLANEVGCSQKHLIAQFRDFVGMSPKSVARIMRFNRAIKPIERGGPIDWSQIALDCGYYDQAHFIRDFNAFAGCTPTELLRSVAGPSFRADGACGG